ncbi:putative vacuolar membrane protein [Spathaspora sp. JA1]|nr:putative vacuolar membrane protein [Spathaspora sp. JA1]
MQLHHQSHVAPNPHTIPDASIVSDPNQVVEIINDQELKNYRLGVTLLVVSVSTWIIGLELVNVVLKGDDYNKPFLFAVISGSFYSLNLIPDVISFIFKRRIQSGDEEEQSESTPLMQSSSSTGSPQQKALEKILSEDSLSHPQELSSYEVFTLALLIAVIYLVYNLCVMEALQFTSASNQTVLGSSSSVFTLLIGAVLKIERFSWKKALCVVCSFMGVFLVNFSDGGSSSGGHKNKFEPKNPRLGNLLALAGALAYALYLICMKIKCGTGNRTTNERRLFGYAGVITLCLGVPILILVDYINFEKFEFPPPNNTILFSVLINGAFSAVSDYTAMLAMLLTSPLVVSLTLTSGIPITIFIDYIITYVTHTGKKKHVSWVYIFGIVCILLAVVLVNINITTENDLIEEVIEEAIEDAIKRDEVMSPVLSPLLGPALHHNHHHPPFITDASFHVGVHSFSPKILTPRLLRSISTYNLNERDVDDQEEIEEGSESKLIVVRGANHLYHVKRDYS